jgi:hypothetical protein
MITELTTEEQAVLWQTAAGTKALWLIDAQGQEIRELKAVVQNARQAAIAHAKEIDLTVHFLKNIMEESSRSWWTRFFEAKKRPSDV